MCSIIGRAGGLHAGLGMGEGQVENQVGLVRERFFTPRLRFKTYDELNAWLLDQCVAYAKAHRHQENVDKTIWEVFEEERQTLLPYRGSSMGSRSARFSLEDLPGALRHNRYSVNASAIGRPSKSTPMPGASSFARMDALSPNILAPSDAARRSSIPGITCRFWRASRAL